MFKTERFIFSDYKTHSEKFNFEYQECSTSCNYFQSRKSVFETECDQGRIASYAERELRSSLMLVSVGCTQLQ